MPVETIEAPITRTKSQIGKPKQLPPYHLIVHNDDDHTYQYVIEVFQKIFKYDMNKSFLLADTIHKNGLAIVWSGSLELAELKQEQVNGMGPDYFSKNKKVTYPLRTTIEPAV